MLYAPIIEGRFRCPIHAECRQDRAVPVLVTDLASAEIIKHAANSFLALKISFANALADICERAGADVLQVTTGVSVVIAAGYALQAAANPKLITKGRPTPGVRLQAFLACAAAYSPTAVGSFPPLR